MKKPKTKTFEVQKCECGHICPVEFIQYDGGDNQICPNCTIEELSDMYRKSQNKNKTLRKKLKEK